MGSEAGAQGRDRHILIAVDESESSKRAVLYVADFLGGVPGFRATVLSIVAAPEVDFFDSPAERDRWTGAKKGEIERLVENYRMILVQSGFPDDKVRARVCVDGAHSFADAILELQCDMNCCTVVVGRHHKSKAEEFLFGSTSSRLVREAKNCAVWVVE